MDGLPMGWPDCPVHGGGCVVNGIRRRQRGKAPNRPYRRQRPSGCGDYMEQTLIGTGRHRASDGIGGGMLAGAVR